MVIVFQIYQAQLMVYTIELTERLSIEYTNPFLSIFVRTSYQFMLLYIIQQTRINSIIMSKNSQISDDVNIRSKYLNQMEPRKLVITPGKGQIAISTAGDPTNFKQFRISDLDSHNVSGNNITMAFNNGRKYQIESNKPQIVHQAIQQSQNVESSAKFVEQPVSVKPKTLNYFALFNPMHSVLSPLQNIVQNNQAKPSVQNTFKQNLTNSDIILNSSQSNLEQPRTIVLPQKQYPQADFFLNPHDWKRDEKTGNFILLNQEWKANASKIVRFVVKKFLTTGSFMGISFPTFAMKPESILQTYAKTLGVAPKLFSNVKDQLERMKCFLCFIYTMSLLNVDLRKSFNPTIGQTFQTNIAGGSYCAQQVCHHPPISAFFYEGKGYKIYASLQLSASIGLNSGQGRFIGDVTLEFSDGYWIKGRLPNGEMDGFVFGETKFLSYGGSYAYDSKNMVCTYALEQNFLYQGIIGELNQKAALKFREKLKSKDRFIKFKKFPREDYRKVYSNMIAKTGTYLYFDQRLYFDFDDKKNFPYIPEKDSQRFILKSDSSFRMDIALRKQMDLEGSQAQKQKIQNEQRRNRTLREKFKPK